MKNFEELGTEEIVKLTEAEIDYYAEQIGDKDVVLEEIENCKRTLDRLGISY